MVSMQTYDPLLFPLNSMADLIGALFFFFILIGTLFIEKYVT